MARRNEKDLKVLLKQWSLFSAFCRYQNYFEATADSVCKDLQSVLGHAPDEYEAAPVLAAALESLHAWHHVAREKGLDNCPVAVASVLREEFARYVLIQRQRRLGQVQVP